MPKAPKKLYNMPEKIPEGTILTDKAKSGFRVGPSIGIGGFGEVYSACKVGEKNYDFVVKCEPSENGPLFVEINFYLRCAKESDVKNYQKKQGLKSFGMPHFVASGSVTLKDKNHRFLVMPRYGRNIEHFFLANGKRLPVGTVWRLAIQMLNVLEYVHHCGYTHGDIKATNMLLGLGKNGNSQAYLVDFGLAARHHTERDFKPDPKKAHNGTMEFESRDAHQGVATMRSDLEILGYNLIYWLGVELPWVRDKLLNVPNKVQAAKVQFMNNLDVELKELIPESLTANVLVEYLKYVNKLKHNEAPDYKKCRKTFQDALKALKTADTGDLELDIKKSNKTAAATATNAKRGAKPKRTAAALIENDVNENNTSEDETAAAAATNVKRAAKSRRAAASARIENDVDERDASDNDIAAAAATNAKRAAKPRRAAGAARIENDVDERDASDDDDDDVIFEPKPKKAAKPGALKTAKVRTSPAKRANTSLKKNTPSPLRTKRVSPRVATANDASPAKKSKTTSPINPAKRGTPLSARANINFSPAISLAKKSSSALTRPGSTIVNDNVTPNPRGDKTYEFNFELDVSMDANVIVNVKRKKKSNSDGKASGSQSTAKSGSSLSNGSKDTPGKFVKVQKTYDGQSPGRASPRTPIVKVSKKIKRV